MTDQTPPDKLCTTSGRPVDDVRADQAAETGQHKDYIVICEEDRRKGFVRPYREAYKHVGIRPKYPTRELTPEEDETYNDSRGPNKFVAFELYPLGSHGSALGRYWTAAELQSGCGTVTTMSRSISETYARNPSFYGATFCCACNRHSPVKEFVWVADGQRVGS